VRLYRDIHACVSHVRTLIVSCQGAAVIERRLVAGSYAALFTANASAAKRVLRQRMQVCSSC
jgi:hypothetical protein